MNKSLQGPFDLGIWIGINYGQGFVAVLIHLKSGIFQPTVFRNEIYNFRDVGFRFPGASYYAEDVSFLN